MEEIKQERYSGIKDHEIMAAHEPHLACVLLLDTSDSMNYGIDGRRPIDLLNEALREFKDKVCRNEITKRRVDICVISFNSNVEIINEFTPLAKYEPVDMTASGCTEMGAAIEIAINAAKQRDWEYLKEGTRYFTPWVIMITDGLPTDSIERAKELIRTEESKGRYGHLKFWALGTPGYDKDTLKSLGTKRVLELLDTDYSKFFDWLRESMDIQSISKVGEEIEYPMLPDNARTVPKGW